MLISRKIKDTLATRLMVIITSGAILFFLAIGLVLFIKGIPVMKSHSLIELLTTSNWRPMKGQFGFLTFIVSTLLVTLLALIISFPLAILSSIYLSEYSDYRAKKLFMPVIDLLSGIPPVIYGVWGTLTLVPFISETLAPHFVDFSTGYSLLAGGIVLAVMILPLMISIFLEIMESTPQDLREASLSLGATKWETTLKVVLRKSKAGILAGVVLAISRAFGETIAVMMVCGNFTAMPKSLFDACYPLPALLANNYGEMMSMPDYESALMLAGFILFIIIIFFNTLSWFILKRIKKGQ